MGTDIIHGILDVAGFIPVVGSVADIANAALYTAQGDWANAALIAVSAIPFVGAAVWITAKSIKMCKNFIKSSAALKKASQMKSLAALRKGKAETGAQKPSKRSRKKALKEEKDAEKEPALEGRGKDEYKPPKGGGGITDTIKVGRKTVTFGHGGRHLKDTGLDMGEVNQTIARDVAKKKGLIPNKSVKGHVSINGTNLEYRACLRPNGEIHIGTYYTIKN